MTTAVAQSFTDATHLGLLIAGIVLLVMAVPAALFVRHRNAPAAAAPAVNDPVVTAPGSSTPAR